MLTGNVRKAWGEMEVSGYLKGDTVLIQVSQLTWQVVFGKPDYTMLGKKSRVLHYRRGNTDIATLRSVMEESENMV